MWRPCYQVRTPVLVVGAQSSLTGGATPMGEVIVSTARLTDDNAGCLTASLSAPA